MQVRVCDSSQDAVKNDASPSASCAIVSSESLEEINANFFGDDKPGIPILLVENPQALRDLELQESPYSQAEDGRSTPALSRQQSLEQAPAVTDVKNEPPTRSITPVFTDNVPPVSAINNAAPNCLSFNSALFASSSSPTEGTEKSNLASLVSATSQLLTTHSPLVTLKEEQNGSFPEGTTHPKDDETDDTAAAAAAILLFKGDCQEANLILGLPELQATEEDALTFSCHEDEIPTATTPEANDATSPFQANVGDVMDHSSGSLEYDSNPPPSSTGSTNSSATEVVGVSVALAGTGSTSSSHRGRGAGSGGSMPGNGASAGSGNGVDLPDTKEGIEELCPVCGDKVSGYHYGLLTCESCKGFFKRTVQNKKVYTCVADRSCHIDKSQRKRCPFCRFQKCLEVGMKLEAVRADRMRGGRNKFGPMYKRDRARKLQTIREKQMRPGGAGTPSSQSSNGGSTPSSQAGLYPTDSTLYSVSGQSSTTSVPLYVTGGGIKHEIQIPQVSSLTSSPDSSPSPLGMPATSYVSHSSTGSLGAANTSLGSEKPLWNNNNTPGSLTNPASNHPNTPSPNHQHPHLSPKQFQFDGLLGSSSTSGSGLGAGLTGLSSGTSPGATPTAKMPPLVREFVQSLDDKEWQSALFGLLQSQSYNQVEVDLFELLCKVLDQNLFSQVDWARNSVFFKDLRVDDQMKMLQHSWSDLLILDHIHQRMHNHLPDETTLPNGQKFELVSLAMLGAADLAESLHDLTRRLQEIRFDVPDYICLKFLLLLNPDVRGLMNRRHVVEAHDQVQQALFDYTLNCYPQVPDKFSKLLAILPDVHSISSRGEDFLYFKHLNGFAPTQTLLMEMLHAKRR